MGGAQQPRWAAAEQRELGLAMKGRSSTARTPKRKRKIFSLFDLIFLFLFFVFNLNKWASGGASKTPLRDDATEDTALF